MNSEEILKRSRNSGDAEGRDFVNQQADFIGFAALCVAILLIAIYKGAKGLPIGDVVSLAFIFLGVGMFARFKHVGGTSYLFLGLAFSLVALGMLATFLVATW